MLDRGYISRTPDQEIEIKYGTTEVLYRLDTKEKIDRYLIIFGDMSKIKNYRDMVRAKNSLSHLIKLFPHYSEHKQVFTYFLDAGVDKWDEKPYIGKNCIIGNGNYGPFSRDAKEILDIVKEDQTIHILQKEKRDLKHEWTPKGYVFPLITFILIAINIYVWFTNMAHPKTLAVTTDDFLSMNIKAFITAGFMHASIFHLIGNMVSLFVIGSALEKETGHIQFGIIYMICGVLSMEGAAEMKWILGDSSATVGASGAIFGLLGAYLVTQLLTPKDFRCDIGAFVGRLAVLTVSGIVTPGIDYRCHIWGFVVGVLATLIYRYAGLYIRQSKYNRIGRKLASYGEDIEIAGRLRI